MKTLKILLIGIILTGKSAVVISCGGNYNEKIKKEIKTKLKFTDLHNEILMKATGGKNKNSGNFDTLIVKLIKSKNKIKKRNNK